VLKLHILKNEKVTDHSKQRLGLKDHEYRVLLKRMDTCNLEFIGFSHFCLFLGEAVQVQDRLAAEPIEEAAIPRKYRTFACNVYFFPLFYILTYTFVITIHT
jgi:hypothetical protein